MQQSLTHDRGYGVCTGQHMTLLCHSTQKPVPGGSKTYIRESKAWQVSGGNIREYLYDH